jgi:caa(3)-type oxidase subunit IV
LIGALLALLALTAVTFGLHFVAFAEPWGLVVALSIAAVKIGIVATIFMELREVRGSVAVVAAVSLGFVALLCAGIAGDVAFR